MKNKRFKRIVLFGAVGQMLCLQGMTAVAQTSTATQPNNTTVPALSTSAPSIGAVLTCQSWTLKVLHQTATRKSCRT